MNDPQTEPLPPEMEAHDGADSSGSETTGDANTDNRDQQITELKDQLLRALADAENTRRRAQKEREDTSKYAVTNFAREMLNVADNFVRAAQAMPDNVNDPAVKNLITGIEATGRQLHGVLEKFGIKAMEPLDQPFDPNFHRVMVEVEHSGKPAGTVVQVLQAGYVIHDRLLREALVAVAKGETGAGAKVDTSA